MKYIKQAILISVLLFFLFTPIAFAHITVSPKTVAPGFQVVTVRVPTEKDNPTVGLRVVVPKGVTVNAVEPVSGWTITTKKTNISAVPTKDNKSDSDEDTSSRITEISWLGGQIGVNEFQDFPLSVAVTQNGDFSWKAYQTYQDGTVVKWEGGKDAKYPASVITVSDHANTAYQPLTENKTTPSEWLSIAALLFSVASLFISLRKK